MSTSARQPLRVLAYSHDSYGLGHVRRSLSVVGAMARRDARVRTLCVTGSPTPHLFDVPPRCDLVKLPCVTKDEEGGYRSRSLPMSLQELVGLRSDLIMASARSFRPHVVLVDHAATGPGAELLPVLRKIRHEMLQTRVVLGMRDVIDAPHRVRAQMTSDGTVDVLRHDYDEILVYGEQHLLDVGVTYDLPQDIRDKTTYVGFACRPRDEGVAPRARPGDTPRLLATAGGGADGYPVLRGVLAALRGPMRDADVAAHIVTGPLMSPDEIAALRLAARGDARIRVLVSTPSMPTLMAGADLVVGMGGYNTVYEALSLGRRLLSWPRSRPRLEQFERCRRLEARGLLTALGDDEVADPVAMAASIERALSAPPPIRGCSMLRFDGAERAAEHVLENLDHAARPATAGSIRSG